MTEQPSRRLAAVMFTDVVGYTALMQDDEEAARVVRLRHCEALEAAIAAHGGELVQYLGDGSLSTFPSVVRAVSAAVEIQRALREHVPLRIGVHQGEIAFDDQGMYGDVLNVANRMMDKATAGSVLLSEKAGDELKNQPGVETHRFAGLTGPGQPGQAPRRRGHAPVGRAKARHPAPFLVDEDRRAPAIQAVA